MNLFGAIFVLICHLYISNCYIVEPGPVVRATSDFIFNDGAFIMIGEIWPKPFEQKTYDYFSLVRPSLLKFEITGQSCDILTEAIRRYKRIIQSILKRETQKKRSYRPHVIEHPNPHFRDNEYFKGFLDDISVNLKQPCEDELKPNMIESYSLRVGNATALLESDTIWGILRGLETFSQLMVTSPDRLALKINGTDISDKPRYGFRGLLVDTSRHFINVFTLKQILDGMAYNKLNVFHWHIVDDHSFPYESKVFPELSARGAYNKHMVYSQNDVHEIIEYARLRGIRTIAEFDTPGHTRSWGVSHPEILTTCEGEYAGKMGPIDPTKNESYAFIEKLFAEVVEVFPDEYIHLGGDEVGFECWQSNSVINEFMKRENITTYEMLEEKYIQKIVDMVIRLKRRSVVWQEVFQNGVQLANDTIVHVWTGDRQGLLYDITKSGFSAILSSCWYLDHLATGGDWRKFYGCEPSDFPGNSQQQSLLLGGEACMWSEVVDNSNILQRIFPRVSATAEKLWSQENVNDFVDAAQRLEEHTCRMKTRGIPAQPPNGPGFCS